MEINRDYLSRFKVEKQKTSERAEILRNFIDRIRDKNGKPYKPSFLGMKLAHLSTPDLYFLLKKCEGAKNFGAMFWYSINVKKRKY